MHEIASWMKNEDGRGDADRRVSRKDASAVDRSKSYTELNYGNNIN